MAISGGDGSIILTTKIDESGITKGTNSIKTAFDKVNNYLKNVGAKIGDNFKKVGSSIKNTFTKLTASLKGLAGQILAFFSIRALLQFSNEASKMASNTEASVQRLIDIYGKASIAVGDFIDANSRGLGLSKAVAASTVATYGNLLSVWADQKTNADLSISLLNQTAVVASRTGRTVEDVAERIRSGLLGNTEAIEDLGINVNIKTIEITDAFKRIADGRSWEKLNAYEQAQVRTLAILEQSTKKYGTEVAKTSAFTRQQYNAAFQDFQNTWGQVVNLVLMPILRIATRILNTLTAGLRVIAGLSGKTIDSNKQFEEQTDHIGGAVDNQEALTDAVKDTAKEQKKLLAGFDDLEILSQKASGNASGDAGVGGVSGTEGLNVLGGEIDEGEYTSKLALIGMVTGWALVGLGIILMFSGHPFIGIGMVASGFVLSAGAGEGGAELGQKEKQKLIKIGTITGVALIGLGVLLLFTSFWKLGLGMVASGATAVYTALALGEFSQDVKKKVTDILLITGTVMMVLGTILLFVPGAEMFGIAMLAAGVAELITAAIMNADQIKQWISENLWVLVAEAGKFLFVVGIMLLFVPGMMNWGIAAMVAGIAIVGVSAIVPNWNEIKTTIKNFFVETKEEIAGLGAALLVLGIILLFVPGMRGLGLGLIIAGAAGLATVVAFNWNYIVEKVKEVWGNIKTFWNENIAPIFTKEWWLELAKKCGNGLIDGFERAVNGIIGMFEKMINWIVDGLNKIKFDVPDWVPAIGGKTFGFNVSKVKFNRVDIPPLAQGTVVPPNRKFLAMLGDNTKEHEIVSPVSTMKQAFTEAMIEMGGNLGGGNTEVVLEIDGREFGRAVVEQGNRENRRIGTRLVIA